MFVICASKILFTVVIQNVTVHRNMLIRTYNSRYVVEVSKTNLWMTIMNCPLKKFLSIVLIPYIRNKFQFKK